MHEGDPYAAAGDADPDRLIILKAKFLSRCRLDKFLQLRSDRGCLARRSIGEDRLCDLLQPARQSGGTTARGGEDAFQQRQIHRPRDVRTEQIVLGICRRRRDRSDIAAVLTDASTTSVK